MFEIKSKDGSKRINTIKEGLHYMGEELGALLAQQNHQTGLSIMMLGLPIGASVQIDDKDGHEIRITRISEFSLKTHTALLKILRNSPLQPLIDNGSTVFIYNRGSIYVRKQDETTIVNETMPGDKALQLIRNIATVFGKHVDMKYPFVSVNEKGVRMAAMHAEDPYIIDFTLDITAIQQMHAKHMADQKQSDDTM